MAFGVFDRLHAGHLYFLRQARLRGDRLVAVIARASAVFKLKKKIPSDSANMRLWALRRLGIVWKAVPGDRKQGSYAVVRKYKPAVICLGYDQWVLRRDIREKIRLGVLPDITLMRLGPYKPKRYHTSIRL